LNQINALDAHVGSGILDDSFVWSKNFDRLSLLVEKYFPKVEFIDVGGGLGVPYKPDEIQLDLTKVVSNLSKIKTEIKLILEPGR
jgi:diaminopimelate decarboxylase